MTFDWTAAQQQLSGIHGYMGGSVGVVINGATYVADVTLLEEETRMDKGIFRDGGPAATMSISKSVLATRLDQTTRVTWQGQDFEVIGDPLENELSNDYTLYRA